MILNESLEVLASSETDFEIVRILVLAMKTAGDGASVSNLCPRNCCPFSLFANKWFFFGGFWFVKNKAINLSFKELFTGQYATSRDLKGKKTRTYSEFKSSYNKKAPQFKEIASSTRH